MFLEDLISTSNLPKPMQMYHRQFWQNRLPALTKLYTGFAKSFTCICGIVYQKSRIWHCIHINYAYPYCRHFEIVNWYLQKQKLIFLKSITSIFPQLITCISRVDNLHPWNWLPVSLKKIPRNPDTPFPVSGYQ